MNIFTNTSNKVEVNNTNSNGKNDSAVRVKLNGVVVVEVVINTRNPAGYLADRKGGAHLADFQDQLTSALNDTELTLDDALRIQDQTGINCGY